MGTLDRGVFFLANRIQGLKILSAGKTIHLDAQFNFIPSENNKL